MLRHGLCRRPYRPAARAVRLRSRAGADRARLAVARRPRGSGVVWPIYLIVDRRRRRAARSTIRRPRRSFPRWSRQEQLQSAIALASSMFQGAPDPRPRARRHSLRRRCAVCRSPSAALLYGASAIAALAVRHRSAPAAGQDAADGQEPDGRLRVRAGASPSCSAPSRSMRPS